MLWHDHTDRVNGLLGGQRPSNPHPPSSPRRLDALSSHTPDAALASSSDYRMPSPSPDPDSVFRPVKEDAALASSSDYRMPSPSPDPDSVFRPVKEDAALASQPIACTSPTLPQPGVRAITAKKTTVNPIRLCFPAVGPSSTTVFASDFEKLADGAWLNDSLIEVALKIELAKIDTIDSALANSVYIYSTYFYPRLEKFGNADDETWRKEMQKWAKIDIFEKRFLVIPVNTSNHWYLVIVVNPNQCIRRAAQAAEKEANAVTAAAVSVPLPTGSNVERQDATGGAGVHKDSQGIPTPSKSPQPAVRKRAAQELVEVCVPAQPPRKKVRFLALPDGNAGRGKVRGGGDGPALRKSENSESPKESLSDDDLPDANDALALAVKNHLSDEQRKRLGTSSKSESRDDRKDARCFKLGDLEVDINAPRQMRNVKREEGALKELFTLAGGLTKAGREKEKQQQREARRAQRKSDAEREVRSIKLTDAEEAEDELDGDGAYSEKESGKARRTSGSRQDSSASASTSRSSRRQGLRTGIKPTDYAPNCTVKGLPISKERKQSHAQDSQSIVTLEDRKRKSNSSAREEAAGTDKKGKGKARSISVEPLESDAGEVDETVRPREGRTYGNEATTRATSKQPGATGAGAGSGGGGGSSARAKDPALTAKLKGWLDDSTVVCVFDSLGGKHGAARTNLRNYMARVYREQLRVTAKQTAEAAPPPVQAAEGNDVVLASASAAAASAVDPAPAETTDVLDLIGPVEHVDVVAPIQPNFCDCGVYLLHNFQCFFNNPDEFTSSVIPSRSRELKGWKNELLPSACRTLREEIGHLSQAWEEKKEAARKVKQKEKEAAARERQQREADNKSAEAPERTGDEGKVASAPPAADAEEAEARSSGSCQCDLCRRTRGVPQD